MPYKKLTKIDIEALEDAVKRYREASNAEEPGDVTVGFGACKLCARYHYLNHKYKISRAASCRGCPVMVFTGLRFCCGTPYDPAQDDDKHDDLSTIEDSLCLWVDDELSDEEVNDLRTRFDDEADFLQSLLDKDPGKKAAG